MNENSSGSLQISSAEKTILPDKQARWYRMWRSKEDGWPEAKESLVSSFDGMVQKHARFHARKYSIDIDLDDLIQDGRIALLKAIETFDESKGVSIRTYVYPAIQRTVAKRARRYAWHRRIGADFYGDSEENAILVEDSEADAEKAEEKEKMKHAIDQALRSLNTRERRVIHLKYSDKQLKDREIGELMGLSRSRVSQLHESALRKLSADTDFHESLRKLGHTLN